MPTLDKQHCPDPGYVRNGSGLAVCRKLETWGTGDTDPIHAAWVKEIKAGIPLAPAECAACRAILCGRLFGQKAKKTKTVRRGG